ncbi:cell wall-binding repeat-containing protein [Candidatus Poriferisodalis sp.]|uniref:cell wall-binding repeat-containing protein n=1 Tax=Candidatus Poriferisodalis sp. TaxID=3101277 RepID=UPI003B01085A
MTTYSKRRGRRSLAAIVAAMLMASVLAVVAGSPAQAANTAFEVKVDTDNDNVPDAREFAGQDRYDTALRVAKNFATSKGGLGAVPVAFVASGNTLVDSISVAGFAGYADAPILLTPTGSLHGGVADFIEDYGVDTVYVLGGTAAVDDATLTAIEGLNNKPMVTRIGGTDRYETAANLAGKIDSVSSWCGTDAASAVLINGGTDMLAYGVAVQTAVYRMQLPLLMTAADELPDATAEFISENDIEHVQIIGSTDIVSAGVASALTTLGVDTVARVDGASASAVSVELAKMANDGCKDTLGLVSADRVALVRGNPDGVVAAPVLATSLTGGFMVTPLVVNEPMGDANSLPASVRDYLAATPKNIGADKLNLGIVAIGGTAAVSQATMDAAIEAAASSGALTVAIGANSDTNKDKAINQDDPVRPDTTTTILVDATTPASSTGPVFTLYFSDDVEPDLAKLQDLIEINGVPAVVSHVASSNTGGACDKRRIDVTLGQPLKGGDTISVVSSTAKFGTGKDQRTVAPTSETVMAAPPDRARPTISIVGIAGAREPRSLFNVSFSDNVMIAGTAVLATNEVRLVPGPGAAADPAPAVDHTAGAATATVTINRPLEPGDRLVISPGAVADTSGNVSAGTSGTAIKAQASPKISSILMSNLKHSARASWTVPETLVAGAAEVNDDEIVITAKPGGDADGAAGNGWTMVFDRASTYSAQKPLDIDVRVDTKGQRVTVRFNNGPVTATLGDLLAALKANAAFDARFTAGFGDCENGDPKVRLGLLTVRNQSVAASGTGRTQFAIEVNFNAFVDVVTNDELLADILAPAAVRTRPTAAETLAAGITRIRTAPTADTADGGLRIVDDLSADTPALTETVVTATPPTRKVRYEMETALVKNLPMARDLVQTAAGTGGGTAVTGPPAIAAFPAVPAVATGYAVDAVTGADNTGAQDKVDENFNASSQVRIAVSSSVKTP